MKRSNKLKSYLSSTARSMKNNDPFQYWKWIIFAFLFYLVFKVVKGVSGGLDKLTTGGTTDYGENSDAGGWFNLSNGVPTDTGGAIAGDPGNYTAGSTKIPSDVQKLVDEIYLHLEGSNVFVYPEIVNRLANLSKSNLWNSIVYWNDKYKPMAGKTLYYFIEGEWGSYYDPALGAIKKQGWQNK